MAKPVTTKLFAAVPSRHNNQVIEHVFALQHAQDYHAGARLSIVRLQAAARTEQSTPRVMCGLGVFSFGFQFGQGGVNGNAIRHRAPRHRIFGPTVGQNDPELDQDDATSVLASRVMDHLDPFCMRRMRSEVFVAGVRNFGEEL